jgi:glycosyltransferase involved in cell wall biosynthesis
MDSMERLLISVVLPVRNHRQFIEERVTTILQQTVTNWECIVVDGCSDDGTWEWLQQATGTDKRFSLIQRKPNGIYDAWNFGIEQCKGKYIYIATSDDTMKPYCFERFLFFMQQHPECGMAHSLLEVIDEQGKPVNPNPWLNYLPQQFYKDQLLKLHVRKAPTDGILHSYLYSVYTSVTQLFISRKLFEQVGLFATNFGAKADFEWCMRASLFTNVLHIPEYLATWRTHDNQLTATTAFDFHKDYLHNASMVRSALQKTSKLIQPVQFAKMKHLDLFYRSRFINGGFGKIASRINRFMYLLTQFVRDPFAVVYFLKTRLKNPLQLAGQAVEDLT